MKNLVENEMLKVWGRVGVNMYLNNTVLSESEDAFKAIKKAFDEKAVTLTDDSYLVGSELEELVALPKIEPWMFGLEGEKHLRTLDEYDFTLTHENLNHQKMDESFLKESYCVFARIGCTFELDSKVLLKEGIKKALDNALKLNKVFIDGDSYIPEIGMMVLDFKEEDTNYKKVYTDTDMNIEHLITEKYLVNLITK